MNLDRDGAEIRENVVSGNEIERWLAAIIELPPVGAGIRGLANRNSEIVELCSARSIRSLLQDANFVLARSILFDKTPEANWPVAWHQDRMIAVQEKHTIPGFGPWSVKGGVVHVQPPSALLASMVTVRLHLDDTPADNGALKVVPGSHLNGFLEKEEIEEWKQKSPETLACSKGDAVLMKPLTLHASSRAVNPGNRRVVHLEFAEQDSLPAPLKWCDHSQ